MIMFIVKLQYEFPLVNVGKGVTELVGLNKQPTMANLAHQMTIYTQKLARYTQGRLDADHEVGIDSMYFERIFGIFQRYCTWDEYTGTGIGLMIYKKWLNSTMVARYGANPKKVWAQLSTSPLRIFSRLSYIRRPI